MTDQTPVNIVPGQALSVDQKKQLADQNVEATKQAHEKARIAMQGDGRSGVEVVAESIAEKFKNMTIKNPEPEE